MFIYYYADGEIVKAEKGLLMKEIIKNQIEHGELLKVIEEKPYSEPENIDLSEVRRYERK